MAHSIIQSYESELEAFRAFASSRPDNCVFLVDTYNTVQSGVPNAITVAKEMEKNGQRALGIRLDSGDLAWLSKAARKMLDDAGLAYMKIAASNQLDEFVIKSLLEQGAPIDIFGVGTKLVTGFPDAALDGVYKLSLGGNKPRLKISENLQKTTLPGKKQVYRIINDNGCFYGADAIVLSHEERAGIIYHPYEREKSIDVSAYQQESLLKKVMEGGRRLSSPESVKNIAGFPKSRLDLLPLEYKRFENPHVYKTSISKELLDLRNSLIAAHKHIKREEL